MEVIWQVLSKAPSKKHICRKSKSTHIKFSIVNKHYTLILGKNGCRRIELNFQEEHLRAPGCIPRPQNRRFDREGITGVRRQPNNLRASKATPTTMEELSLFSHGRWRSTKALVWRTTCISVSMQRFGWRWSHHNVSNLAGRSQRLRNKQVITISKKWRNRTKLRKYFQLINPREGIMQIRMKCNRKDDFQLMQFNTISISRHNVMWPFVLPRWE